MADTRFKICCIQDEAEARLAIKHGASAIGLVSRMPSGPGPISIEQIATIMRSLHATNHIVDTFLLTCEIDAETVIEQLKITGCNTVQLCDEMQSEIEYGKIRAALPNVRIVQVIHVEGDFSLDDAFRAQQHVDALLLDSGRPNAAIKELGGTGRAHDWTLSRRIVGESKVPVYLAGGLNPSNAESAIREVGPYALDVCSGVRTDGKLDPAKLEAFAKAIAAA
jgi:phosphoribosylanthranilate isomerase